MRLPFLLALVAICPLLGCGFAGRCSPSTEVYLYTVSRYDIDPDYNPFQDFDLPRGMTRWECGEPTNVWVLDDLSPEDTAAVLKHELWHVAGFNDHLTDDLCIATRGDPDLLMPCPEELERMQGVDQVFRLHATPDVWEATAIAADWWNDALGREVFLVE